MKQAVQDQDLVHIDARCAHWGRQIVVHKGEAKKAKRLQTLTRNGLYVLREQGLYALYLFLKYREGDGGNIIWAQIKGLWQDPAVGPLLPAHGAGPEHEAVIALTEKLSDVVLARRVTAQALIYGLYGLRAEDKG